TAWDYAEDGVSIHCERIDWDVGFSGWSAIDSAGNTLHDCPHLDGRLLSGEPQACDPGSTACSKRFGLWRRCIPFHEFHRSSALWSTASTKRGHDCFKGQRCPGSSVLHWITHLTSRASICERTGIERNLSLPVSAVESERCIGG